MAGLGKLFLTLVIIAIGGLLLIGGGAWYWWNQHSAELIEAAKATVAEGQQSGRTLEESGCVIQALERHKADWNRTMASAIRNGLWLTGCLDASRPQQRFYDGVPPEDNPVATGVWAGSACVHYGLTDPYCHTLFQNVSKYCASPRRAAKLKTGT